MPFGELLVDNSTVDLDYRFSAKETDRESGLGYFGARYYDNISAMWLGVDPLWEKYAGMSPYNYCAGNPVMLVDRDGREIIIPTGKGSNISYTPGITNVSDVNGSFERNVVTALNYLYANGSPKVRATLDRLSDPQCYYKISICYSSVNSNADDICGMPFKQNGIVEWDMSGMELSDGTILSPAVGLYHELGHVDLFLQSIEVDQQLTVLKKDPIKNKSIIQKLSEVDYIQRAGGTETGWGPGEFCVNREYETDAAVSLGEFKPSLQRPYTRDFYKDWKRSKVVTINVTSVIEKQND